MIKRLPLALDTTEFSADHIIAYRLNGQAITWTDMLARLAFWQAELQAIENTKVAVYHSDSVEFLCIILILWRMGKTPVIAANQLKVTLQSVALETDCFIGEFAAIAETQSRRVGEQMLHATVEREPQKSALIMFTSGSSGTPVAIYKTFAQINAELSILDSHWGENLKQTVVASTVSHHHMYGLPFHLFWPLVAGRAFISKTLTYLEQLLVIKNKEITLITSPTHLEHIPNTPDWMPCRQSIRAIFSAGASLSAFAAKDCLVKTAVIVTEIYGSTETGAVAYRQLTESPHWQPLKGVLVKEREGKLAINSPAAVVGSWYVTEDLCKIEADHRFSLLGRADKIIKVGGKRISITAIESRLSTHAWVNKVHIVLLEKRKNRVGAVIQLTDEGNAKLVDQGKLAISRELNGLLNEHVEKIAWPRYWRFVSQMPVNQQGKTTKPELEVLFDNALRPGLPHVLQSSADKETGKYLIEFVVPHDLLYLEGHFPGQPILPGVVQVGWAIHFFKTLFGDPGDFMRLEALKFQQVIQPGKKICLNLVWDQTQDRLTFHYTGSEYSYASGRIVFSGKNEFTD